MTKLILDDCDDIRRYLKNVKEGKIFLSLDRKPIRNYPREAVADDYSLTYTFDNTSQIKEIFFTLLAKNTANKLVDKELLEHNFIPVKKNTLEKIWAQIGHRLGFMSERNISFSLYDLYKEKIDLTKNLPPLPYIKNIDLTLNEIMEFAKKEFIDYERLAHAWYNDTAATMAKEMAKEEIKKRNHSSLKTFN